MDGMNKIILEKEDLSTQIVRIDKNGKINNRLDDNQAVAMSLKVNEQSTIYKVKVDRDNKLYDPQQEGFNYNLNKLDNITGVAAFKFRQVSPGCFDAYINFLKTKHKSILVTAERMI